MSDRGRAIYLNAKRFANAGYALNSFSQPQNPDMLLPSLVSAALALELYFNALFYLEKSADFKISGRHSHDFSRLFDELAIPTQAAIERNFDDLILKRPMSDVEIIEEKTSFAIPRDLRGNLRAWSEVFVEVRYIHDCSGKFLPMMFFPEIEASVLQVIQKLQPGWNLILRPSPGTNAPNL